MELLKLHDNPDPKVFIRLSKEEEELERKRIRALFDRIDTGSLVVSLCFLNLCPDNNGMLGANELQQEIIRLQLPFAQNQIREILRGDRNKDGSIRTMAQAYRQGNWTSRSFSTTVWKRRLR